MGEEASRSWVARRGNLVLGGSTLVIAAGALAGLVAAALPHESTFEPAGSTVAAFLALPFLGTFLLNADSMQLGTAQTARRVLLAVCNAAAFAFVLSLDLAYDGYYGDGTRFIDRGPVGWGMMLLLGGAAAAVIAVAFRSPQMGGRATALLLWLFVLVGVYLHSGH